MNTYALLKADVISWLNREGFADMEAMVDSLMGIAQRRIYREADLRCMEEGVTTTTATLSLPADYQRTKHLYIAYGGEVTGAPMQKVMALRKGNNPGCPQVYARQGDNIVFGPVPDQEYDYTLLYYKNLPVLSDSNTTNWFTENAPELILFGTLVEACLYLKDDNRAKLWQSRYEDTKNELEMSDLSSDKEYGGMQVRAI